MTRPEPVLPDVHPGVATCSTTSRELERDDLANAPTVCSEVVRETLGAAASPRGLPWLMRQREGRDQTALMQPNPNAPSSDIPSCGGDERETLLGFLDWKRASVLTAARGLSDDEGQWTPDGKLLPIGGIVSHLTHVETRWLDGRFLGLEVPAPDHGFEFGTRRPLAELIDEYCQRRVRTNEIVRGAADLTVPCPGGSRPIDGLDLRWVLVHLIDETSHHAGHADATRELLDGTKSTNW